MSSTSGQAVAAGRVRAPRPSAAERLVHGASKLTLPVLLLLRMRMILRTSKILSFKVLS